MLTPSLGDRDYVVICRAERTLPVSPIHAVPAVTARIPVAGLDRPSQFRVCIHSGTPASDLAACLDLIPARVVFEVVMDEESAIDRVPQSRLCELTDSPLPPVLPHHPRRDLPVGEVPRRVADRGHVHAKCAVAEPGHLRVLRHSVVEFYPGHVRRRSSGRCRVVVRCRVVMCSPLGPRRTTELGGLPSQLVPVAVPAVAMTAGEQLDVRPRREAFDELVEHVRLR